jgi:hypothetical protein
MKLSKVLAITLLGAVATTNTAMASGTTAGTKISNTPTLTYSMGGANKSLKAPTSAYVVDKVINFTVKRDTNIEHTIMVGGQAVAPYTITNIGNSVENFIVRGKQSPLKQFNFTKTQVFIDKNGNGVLDKAEKVNNNIISKLKVDGKRKIWLSVETSAKTALKKRNGYGVQVSASAKGIKEIYTKQTVKNTMAKVDILFADTKYGAGGDNIRDNILISWYNWTSIENSSNVKLDIVKEYEKVIEDPVNGTKDPKAIPGAQVLLKYQIINKTKTEAKNVTFTINYDVSKVRLAAPKEIAGYYGIEKPYFIIDSRGKEIGKAVETKKGTITFTIPSIKAGVTYYPHTATIIK